MIENKKTEICVANTSARKHKENKQMIIQTQLLPVGVCHRLPIKISCFLKHCLQNGEYLELPKWYKLKLL